MTRSRAAALPRLLRFAGVCALPLLVVLASRAGALDDSSLSPVGALHRVASDPLSGGGSRILHTIQYADGTSTTKPIPGTEDTNSDTCPSISVEPAETGRAVAVWTRMDSGDDKIALSIFDGSRWGSIRLIPDPPNANDFDAHVVWGASGIIHVMWRADSLAGSQYWWAQFDSSGRPLSGPAPAPSSPNETVGDNGGAANPLSTIESSQVLFAFVRPAAGGGGMVLFGGRDEPNPIGCMIVFAVPRGGTSGCDHPLGALLHGRIGFTFRYSGKLYYSVRDLDLGIWTPYRVMSLSADVPEDRARSLVRDMIERVFPATP